MQRHILFVVLASLAIPPAQAARTPDEPIRKGVDSGITGRTQPVMPKKTPELVGAPMPGSADLETDPEDLQLHPKTFSDHDRNGNPRPHHLRPSMTRAPMPSFEPEPAPESVQAPLPPRRPESFSTPTGIELYASGNYRLRAGPWGRVQLIIPRGAPFQVVGRKGDWYIVKYKGKVGYVHKDGITHPLAASILAEPGLEKFSKHEAAEIAACVQATQSSPLGVEFKDFLHNIQTRLHGEASTEAPKATPLPPVRPDRLPAELKTKPVKPATTLPSARPGARPGRTVDAEDVFMKRPTIQKLAAEARKAARKYRPYARHVCKRMGRGYPCGGHANPGKSKGWCKAGVREAMERTFGFSLPGDSAVGAERYLEKRMAKVEVDSCAQAPVGSVCLYDTPKHKFGHIEIKASNNEYCSDFCAARPIRGSYRLIGVYYPAKE